MPRLVPEVFEYHRQRAETMRRTAMADFFCVLRPALQRAARRLFRRVVALRATRATIH